jgi:hypothetical protein
MDLALWLKIWLAVLAVPVAIGCFPYIVMYFRVNGRPMWEHPFWHKHRIGRYLIPMPEGGYSPETWTAIRPMPVLYLLVGIGYFVFFGLALAGSVWAYPAGLIVLPLVLHDIWAVRLRHGRCMGIRRLHERTDHPRTHRHHRRCRPPRLVRTRGRHQTWLTI